MSGLTIVRYVEPSPAQWDIVITGMRNSWESWEKGDSIFRESDGWDGDYFQLEAQDRDLALRLAKLGSDHGKYLRMLPVIVDIKAPGYFFREFDTYRIGVEASDITQNSTSMMHTLGKRALTEDDYCFDNPASAPAQAAMTAVELARQTWVASGKRKGPEVSEWRQLQQALPYAILYTRTVSLNYQVLRSMYHARKYHRLAEWRGFCAWCETLEYSDLITQEAK
jgi:hypothetical protein